LPSRGDARFTGAGADAMEKAPGEGGAISDYWIIPPLSQAAVAS